MEQGRPDQREDGRLRLRQTRSRRRRPPFWVTGPWAVSDIQKAGVSFKAVQVPPIAKASVPFLGVNGMMVTKFAATHGVDSAAKDLVMNFFATPCAQTQLAAADGRAPGEHQGEGRSTPMLAQFGNASQGRRPDAEHPPDELVWSDLGQAWVRSTKGAGAMPAAQLLQGRGAQHLRTRSASPNDQAPERAPAGARSVFSPRAFRERRQPPRPPPAERAVPAGTDLARGRLLLGQRGLRDQDRRCSRSRTRSRLGRLRPVSPQPLAGALPMLVVGDPRDRPGLPRRRGARRCR